MRGSKRPTAQRTHALGIAVVDGAAAASRETGIPENTIRSWMDTPEFVELRSRKQEEVDQEWWAFVQKGFRRVADLLESTDDAQRAATATAIIYDKWALGRGQATMRTETRSLTDGYSDTEKERLRDFIDKLDDPDSFGDQAVAAGDTEGAGSEVR